MWAVAADEGVDGDAFTLPLGYRERPFSTLLQPHGQGNQSKRTLEDSIFFF